jgi:DNA-binding LacI/PurR family transcriptional regulator
VRPQGAFSSVNRVLVVMATTLIQAVAQDRARLGPFREGVGGGDFRSSRPVVRWHLRPSVATVSKVINGRSGVAPTTRARVQDLLRQHDYVGRRVESARRIELFFQYDLNPYSTEILQGVLDAAGDLTVRIAVTVRSRGQRNSDAAAWARDLAAGGRQDVVGVTTELSDEVALGVIEAARVRGLRIPEDISVVGFDDTHLARRSSPPLTTVRQPLREMGAVALRTALQLAAGEKVDSRHVELATALFVRRSTARVQRSPTPAGQRFGSSSVT